MEANSSNITNGVQIETASGNATNITGDNTQYNVNNRGTINNTTNYYTNVNDIHLFIEIIKKQQQQIDRLAALLEKTNMLALEAINKTTETNQRLLGLHSKLK